MAELILCIMHVDNWEIGLEIGGVKLISTQVVVEVEVWVDLGKSRFDVTFVNHISN